MHTKTFPKIPKNVIIMSHSYTGKQNPNNKYVYPQEKKNAFHDEFSVVISIKHSLYMECTKNERYNLYFFQLYSKG